MSNSLKPALLQQLIDTVPIPVFVFDGDDALATANRAAAKLLGAEPAALLGETPALFERLDIDAATVVTAMAAARSTAETRTHTFSTRGLGLQMHVAPLEEDHVAIHLQPAVDSGRDDLEEAWVAVLAERKEAQDERAKLAARARQHERLEALGALASGIAHDFNNMLSPILTYTYLLQEESDAATRRKMLQSIRTATEKGAELIKQIHTFGRDPSGPFGAIEVGHLLGGAVALVRASLPSHIRIETDIPADLHITGEIRQLQTAIVNICANAAEAMPGGGTLTLTAGARDLEPMEAQSLNLIPGRYVTIAIDDDGHGIPDGVIGRIFEPFFSTKSGSEGTGMGLASAHGILKVHRGAISVETQPGVGSTFTLFVPAREAAPAAAPQSRRSERPAPREECIMVLDDDSAVLIATCRLLERAGYRTEGFLEVPSAVAALEKAPDGFGAALIDYTMPDYNGLDAARMLRAVSPALPIVLTTGKVTAEIEAHAEAMNILGPLAKPFTPKQLKAAIVDALDSV